jgi:hypothetical protein
MVIFSVPRGPLFQAYCYETIWSIRQFVQTVQIVEDVKIVETVETVKIVETVETVKIVKIVKIVNGERDECYSLYVVGYT